MKLNNGYCSNEKEQTLFWACSFFFLNPFPPFLVKKVKKPKNEMPP